MATLRLNVRTAGVHSDEIQAQRTSFDEGSVDKRVSAKSLERNTPRDHWVS